MVGIHFSAIRASLVHLGTDIEESQILHRDAAIVIEITCISDQILAGGTRNLLDQTLGRSAIGVCPDLNATSISLDQGSADSAIDCQCLLDMDFTLLGDNASIIHLVVHIGQGFSLSRCLGESTCHVRESSASLRALLEGQRVGTTSDRARLDCFNEGERGLTGVL